MAFISRMISSKPNYGGNESWEFLAEQCRLATAKDVRSPHEELKKLIVMHVNGNPENPGAVVPAKIVADILKRRLDMQNPHKQWLAVDLVRTVLGQCADHMRMYRTDMLAAVAKVSVKPNKRGPVEAKKAARRQAIEFLKSQGPEGLNAIRMASGVGGGARDYPQLTYQEGFQTTPNAQGGPSSPQNRQGGQAGGATGSGGSGCSGSDMVLTGDVIVDIKTLIETAKEHAELLQEMMLAADENDAQDANLLVKELGEKIEALKKIFPNMLEKLTAIKTTEAEQLTAQALEAADMLDGCMDLKAHMKEAAESEKLAATSSLKTAASATPAAPAPPPLLDLLSFDPDPAEAPTDGSAPTAGTAGAAHDPFASNAMSAALPGAEGGSHDPFMGRNPNAAAPAAQSANPFDAPEGLPSAPQPGAPANPFGNSAFGANPFQNAPSGGPHAQYGPGPPQQQLQNSYQGPPQQGGYASPQGFQPQNQNSFQNNYQGGAPLPQGGYRGPPPQGYSPQQQQQFSPQQQQGGQGYGPPQQYAPHPGWGAPSPNQQPQYGVPHYGSSATGYAHSPTQHAAFASTYTGYGPPPQYGGPAQAQQVNPFAAAAPSAVAAVPVKYTNAFDDLLAVTKRQSAKPSGPMATPMAAAKRGVAASGPPSPAVTGAGASPAAPKAAAAAPKPTAAAKPTAADPFDLLAAPSSPAAAPVAGNTNGFMLV